MRRGALTTVCAALVLLLASAAASTSAAPGGSAGIQQAMSPQRAQVDCPFRADATVCAVGAILVIPTDVPPTTQGGWCPIMYDWGDGSSETWDPPAEGGSHEFRHAYTESGTYTLRRLVGQEEGCASGTVQASFTVTIGPTVRGKKTYKPVMKICSKKADYRYLGKQIARGKKQFYGIGIVEGGGLVGWGVKFTVYVTTCLYHAHSQLVSSNFHSARLSTISASRLKVLFDLVTNKGRAFRLRTLNVTPGYAWDYPFNLIQRRKVFDLGQSEFMKTVRTKSWIEVDTSGKGQWVPVTDTKTYSATLGPPPS